MFGKNLVLTFGLCFSFLACAEPKYVREVSQDQERSPVTEDKATCPLSFPNSGLCISWKWDQKPTATEYGSLVFKTYRLNSLDQTPIEVDPAQLPTVVLWMPSMGHGSSPTKTSRMDIGTFITTNVFFSMPGKWELKFQLKEGNAVIDEAKDSLTF